MNRSAAPRSPIRGFFRTMGPALIVASVVLGPGSILSSSKVGAAYGLSMAWVLLLAAGLMMAMVALGARLGVVLERSMCDELASRIGRPFAAVVGLTIFLICAAFQFGNNLGVLAALDPWLRRASHGPDASVAVSIVVLLLLNGAIIVFLFCLRSLYKPIERLMMLLVGLMILAFFANFVYLLAHSGTHAGAAAAAPAAPTSDSLIAVFALIGTTFSIAGAFYQAYLVREKGWGRGDLRRGLIDSVAGISVLGLITLVIMVTAAISFHGQGVVLKNVADVARQLQPLFGPAAVVLFSLGLFAASFSSFLVNAMIGGAMLSDGLGLGGKMDSTTTKVFTTVALLLGMLVAIFVPPDHRVGLLIFAQALVVIGLPLLALSMLYLATRPDLTGQRSVPGWMKLAAAASLLVVLVTAGRLAWKIALADLWLRCTG